jgi:plasmid stabilization system protein ParE
VAAYLGYASVPTVAGPVEIEWSLDSLADLDRFATFLHEQFPDIAARVANELIARADVLRRHPKLGRPIATREEYREIVLQVLGGTYVLQYRYDDRTVLMLRVFHSRESRE